ncbi:MAG: hypothetical protein V3V01_13955 [Acidimicrobiales bacterium]
MSSFSSSPKSHTERRILAAIAALTLGVVVVAGWIVVGEEAAAPQLAPTSTTLSTTPPPVDCGTVPPSDLLVPGCGVWLGSSDRRTDELDLAIQEEQLGRQFEMVRLYAVGPDASFFDSRHLELADSGHRLVYSWKVSTDNGPGPVWRRVAAGEFDEQLRRAAGEIAESGHTAFFSLHHEPEDNALSQGGEYGTDEDYAAMLRHAHDLMEPIAGGQIIWFINYMGHSFGDFDQVEAMYPGDDVVDWISWNPYNWFGCHGNAPWKSFKEQARPFYRWSTSNHPGKPLMIGETATDEQPGDDAAKATWVDEMAESLESNFPEVRALLWFHQSRDSGFCERRWDSSTASLDAFVRLGSSEYFNPRH